MGRVILKVDRDEKSSMWGYVCDSLLEGESLSPVCKGFISEALRVFRPTALQYVEQVSVSRDIFEKPHELQIAYVTSFVNDDFEDANEDLTPFGQHLKKVDGWIYGESLTEDDDTVSLLEGQYWNPEWPLPVRIRLDWESSNPPYDLAVVCAADSDEQFLHLLLHTHFEDIAKGMLPVLEDFLNRKIEELQKDHASV